MRRNGEGRVKLHSARADVLPNVPTHRELSLDTGRRSGSGWAVLAALVVPLAGFWLGVVYLMRERIGKGLAMILLGFVCFGAWGVVMSVAFAVGTEQAVSESLRRATHRPVSVRIGGPTADEYTRRVRACERKTSTVSQRGIEELDACMARAGE